MTEAEWDACADPTPMLKFLRGKASDRKLRLFHCACVRRAWHLLNETGRRAVEAAEAYADGRIGVDTLQAAWGAAYEPVADAIDAASLTWTLGTPLSPSDSAAAAAMEACRSRDSDSRYFPLHDAAEYARAAFGGTGGVCAAQAALLRDTLGNRFRPPLPLPAAVLAWNDDAIRKMAQVIYDDRAFDRLPILADALEEAGCTDAAILAHCRESGEHVRGCWVLDLLLGKE